MRILGLLFFILLLASCQQGNSRKEQTEKTVTGVVLKEEVLNIGKMHCEMCVASIEKGLKSVEGVEFVQVSLDDSTAVVRYDAAKADIDKFKEAIEKRGYVLKDNGL